jgi:predicted GIY-YIG superfamily endonuclease
MKTQNNIYLRSSNPTVPIGRNTSTMFRRNVYEIARGRFYSTSTLDSGSPFNQSPIPALTLSNLKEKNHIKSYRNILKNKKGVYCFTNTMNGKLYIASAKDLYIRLLEHLCNKKSNIALQKAFEKYGINKFNFCIYEYFTYKNKITSHKALTELETSYIQKFNFDILYKFKVQLQAL